MLLETGEKVEECQSSEESVPSVGYVDGPRTAPIVTSRPAIVRIVTASGSWRTSRMSSPWRTSLTCQSASSTSPGLRSAGEDISPRVASSV